MNSLNILIIPAWYNHKDLQTGIFIHEFCEALIRRGHKVHLLYIRLFSPKQLLQRFGKTVFSFHINYNVVEIKKTFYHGNFISPENKEKFTNSLIASVMTKIEKPSFDIIHFQSMCNNITPLIGSELAIRLKKPYVITEHYTSFKEAKGSLFKPYLDEKYVRNVVKGSNTNVAVSEFAAAMFTDYFGNPFTSIPNIIAKAFFSTPFVPIKRANTFKFIFIGGLTKRKGISELLQAFCLLEQSESNTSLTIVGEGDLMAETTKTIKESGLEPKVILTGKRTEKEIIELLDSHHCLVSASQKETFGLVIAECHLRGRPVVAYNSGAVRELINDSNGILCNGDNIPSALHKAMKDMVSKYDKYEQRTIRDQCFKKFDEGIILHQYETIYSSAIANTLPN